MQLTYNAIKAGAVGVDMGRNIWQSENPVPMIRAIRAIVHQNTTVDQAFKLYKQLCNENKSKTNKPKNNKQKNKPNQNKQKNLNQIRPNQNKQKNKPNQNKQKNLNQNKPQENKK